jgi:hypothetical protein
MKRRNKKLLMDMSTEELSSESEWHASKAAILTNQVRKIRELALTAEIAAAGELLRSAMQIEFEADEHFRQANILDSLRAARVPKEGVGVVLPVARAYTVGKTL